jgi:uncharacterized protein (TIGR03083 family)
MMGEEQQAVDQLAILWASVSALCRPFDERHWKAPTDCPGWSVQDQLSHLVGTERLLAGKPETSHRAPEREYVHNAIGRIAENHADERRVRSGAEVLHEFDEITSERLFHLRRATADDFAQPTVTPTGPGTVADFLRLRVMDTWVHEQDIRRAVAIPGHRDGPAAEYAIDFLLQGVPMVVGKRAAAPAGSSVRLMLRGPVWRDRTVAMAERASWVDETPATPTVTITLDSDAYLVAAAGRRPGQSLLDAGLVEFAGDSALGERVVTGLNVMI